MSIIPNRAAFFDAVRSGPFNGALDASQEAGIGVLLDCWDRKPELQDPLWLAYMLATMMFETGGAMMPVAEVDKGYGRAYGVPDTDTGQAYYGRGYIPMRWKWQYSSWGRSMGKDFLNNPDLVMQPDTAIILLVEGMKHGLFTGIPLGERHGGDRRDPLRARQSVDGRMGHAEEVAALYPGFLNAINAVRCGQ